MKTLTRYLYVSGLLAILASTACGQSKEPDIVAKIPKKPMTFRIAVAAPESSFPQNASPSYFNPHHGSIGHTVMFVYETLLEYTGEFGLAKSISISADEKEAIVELPKGILFHDGSELTADDVVYSFDSYKNSNREKKKALNIVYPSIMDSTAAKLDNNRVAIRSKRPIDYRYALMQFDIINSKSRKIFENNGAPISAPNGTGPYRVANVDMEGKTIILTANPAYRLGEPRIKKIEMALFNTLDAASMALLTSKADYNPIFTKMAREMLGNPGDFTMFPYEHDYCTLLLLNTSRPHLRDARVRRALSLLVERNKIIQADGPISVTRSPTITFLNLSHPKTAPVSEPLQGAEAIRLLTEAGLKYKGDRLFHNGKPFTLEISMLHGQMTDHSVQAIRKMIKQWENAGLFCDFKTVDDFEKIKKGKFDALFTAWLENKSVSMTMEGIYKIDGDVSGLDMELPDIRLKQMVRSLRNETREDVLLEKKLAVQQRLKETCPLIPLYYETGYGALGWAHNSDEDIRKALSKDPVSFSYLARLR